MTTRTPPNNDRTTHDAIVAAVAAPTLSPALPVRLSYASSDRSTRKRKVIQHATPPTDGRSPPFRRSPSSVAIDGAVPLDPTVTPPSRIIHPTASTFVVTQSQSPPPSPNSARIICDPTPMQPPRNNAPSKYQRRKKTSSQQNKLAVLNKHIFQWSRSSIFANQESIADFDLAAFNLFSKRIDELLLCKFQAKRPSKAASEDRLGLGRRSEVHVDQLDDEDADHCKTADIKRLSRLHWEDSLVLSENDPLVLFFPWDGFLEGYDKSLPKLASKIGRAGTKLISARKQQKKDGTGGEFVTIGGRKYVILRATIVQSREYHSLHSGAITLSKLQVLFSSRGGGFTISFDDTSVSMLFCWRDVQEFANDVFFFGRPHENSRRYNELFRRKGNINYIRHVYQSMVM